MAEIQAQRIQLLEPEHTVTNGFQAASRSGQTMRQQNKGSCSQRQEPFGDCLGKI